jgi:hypothetical protein
MAQVVLERGYVGAGVATLLRRLIKIMTPRMAAWSAMSLSQQFWPEATEASGK